jgi:putative spermidine/putrescine transport system ATP-binding protein
VEQSLAPRDHLGPLSTGGSTRLSGFLSLDRLARRYGEVTAVADVTLNVERGESVALLGPSGCGKTTTLRMVAGLVAPSTGQITLAGRDLTGLPAYRRNMGYVFQSYALFPHMDVAANVGFGLDERGVARAERDRKVAQTLELVRLGGLGGRRPRELSGGQQQRVALARALVISPDVLLLDESLSNLDAKLRDAMRIEIRDLQRSLAITTLFVTHDQTEALTLCDRIAVMSAGRIEQIGTPREVYDRPASRFVADFVGRCAVLRATRRADGGLAIGDVPIRTTAPLPPGEALDVFLRPQRIGLTGRGEAANGEHNRLEGKVAAMVFVGERLEVLVDTAAGRVTVELPSGGYGAGAPAAGVGEEVALNWSAADTLVFAADGP